MITELILLFEGLEPTLPLFAKKTEPFTLQERLEWNEKICRISLANWSRANARYRNFLANWIVAHRQEFINFYRHETVMSRLMFPAGGEPEMLIVFFRLWYEYSVPENASMRQLMFLMALAFDQPYSLKTLCNRAAAKRMDAGDLLDMLGWVRLG